MCANILVERVAVSINRVLRSGTWMPNRSGFRNYTPVFAREAPLNFVAEFTCPERKSTASATRLPARNSSLSGKLITACCVYLETNRLLIKLPSTRLKFTSIPADPRSCHRTCHTPGAPLLFSWPVASDNAMCSNRFILPGPPKSASAASFGSSMTRNPPRGS